MNQFFLSLFCILLIGCSNTTNPSADQKKMDTPALEISKEFQEFYTKFHEDSIFQLAHIQFPVQTKAIDPAVVQTIAKEDWVINKPIDLSEGFFEKQFVPVGDNLLIEYINHTSAPLFMERRFARLKKEWMLIYYTDLLQYN